MINKSSKIKNIWGFSLVETLIATTVASVAGVLLISLLIQNNGLYSQQSSKISQGLNLNDSASKISSSIKSAASVATSYTSNGTTYTSDNQTLVLTLPSIDGNSNVIDNVYDNVVIYKDSQKPYILRKQTFPSQSPPSSRRSENTVLATTLKSVSFLYYDSSGTIVSPAQASRVNFTINLSNKASYGNQTSSISSQINLKNN